MHADAMPDADRATLADPADVAARIAARSDGAEHARAARASRPQRAARRRAHREGRRTWPRERARATARLLRDRRRGGRGRAIARVRDLPRWLRGRRSAGRQRRRDAARVAARRGRRGGARRGAPAWPTRATSAWRGRALRRRRLAHAAPSTARAPPRLAAGPTCSASATGLARERRRASRRCRRGWCDCASTATAPRCGPRSIGHGRPVQYSYLARRRCALWHVQTRYAARPWAAEMPSAGRAADGWRLLRALRRRGRRRRAVTHAAGLSATGDPALDARAAARRALRDARGDRGGGRSARARRGGARDRGRHQRGARARGGGGVRTAVRPSRARVARDLRIGAGFAPRVVDGLLTGMHEPGDQPLRAAARVRAADAAARARTHSGERGLSRHEFGDSCLVL